MEVGHGEIGLVRGFLVGQAVAVDVGGAEAAGAGAGDVEGMGGDHHYFGRFLVQDAGGGAIDGGMGLEDAGVLNGDDVAEGYADIVLGQFFQVGLLAVGEGDQAVALAVGQAAEAGNGVGVGLQVVVHGHKLGDGGGFEGDVVPAQAVDEGAAAGFPVAAVAEHEEVVLVLLDALAVAPVLPEVGGGDGGAAFREEAAGGRGEAAAQVEDGAE